MRDTIVVGHSRTKYEGHISMTHKDENTMDLLVVRHTGTIIGKHVSISTTVTRLG